MKLLIEILEGLKEKRGRCYQSLSNRAENNKLSWLERRNFFQSDAEYQKLEKEIEILEKFLAECLFGLGAKVAQASCFVIDKKTAIELLCMTPAAWRVLDKSLKSDPEVIMYYQPLGHKDVKVSDVDSNLPETGVCAYVDTRVLGQRGFEVVYEEALKEAGLISSTIEYKTVLSKPKIDFPEGFDYETYFKIQSELSKKTLDIRVSPLIEESLFDNATSEDSYVCDVKLKIYDRALLSDIVAKYAPSTKESVKTIGTYPTM